jgi:hypothetical protein
MTNLYGITIYTLTAIGLYDVCDYICAVWRAKKRRKGKKKIKDPWN